jgi:hypothetical protein
MGRPRDYGYRSHVKRAAIAGFDAFVTADQNLQFQQNLAGSAQFVIVLVAASNALEDLLPAVPQLRTERDILKKAAAFFAKHQA